MQSFSSYKNPALATDLVVFGYHEESLSVLLLNRKEAPFKNEWTLPGAFVQMEESLKDTCNRILETKLGTGSLYLEQLYTFDEPLRDPRGRVVSVGYFALVNPSVFRIVAGKMTNDVKWFNIKKIPALGFDHPLILQKALDRLKSKLLYYPVGFELLDELFTMTELQTLYETILGVEIDRRNFRRKILDAEFIINTGQRREGLQNRPADLYKFNKKLKQHTFHLNIP